MPSKIHRKSNATCGGITRSCFDFGRASGYFLKTDYEILFAFPSSMIMKTFSAMRSGLYLGLFMCATIAASAVGYAQTVRVLYYTGDVQVVRGGSTTKARLGEQLKQNDKVKIGSSSTLQLSIDGKVLKYSKAMTLKVSDAIARAGKGENSVVANTARTLAGASGAGRNARTSVAGATRASGKEEAGMAYVDSLEMEAVNTSSMRLNSELESMTGIGDPIGVLRKASDEMRSEALIILQPRSTAVSPGPVRFRWKKSAGVKTYVVTVKNYLGDEVFRSETSDTSLLWNEPGLEPEEIYTWRLSEKASPSNAYGASFHRLSQTDSAILMQGITGILEELGPENPAVPLILGTFYSDIGCYGEAAETFTAGALASEDHGGTLWEMACEQYLFNMFVPVEEGIKICEGK